MATASLGAATPMRPASRQAMTALCHQSTRLTLHPQLRLTPLLKSQPPASPSQPTADSSNSTDTPTATGVVGDSPTVPSPESSAAAVSQPTSEDRNLADALSLLQLNNTTTAPETAA
eukprot:m.108324 g.108324  ORF g.108324 m.108324 type:complete len:117 (-) comp15335_c0_seq1:298-648(-)